jgi:hypothetical protein
MAEECCLATTRVAWWLRCGRSGFGALKPGFGLVSFQYTYTVESMYIQLRLKARLPERNYCLSREVSAFEHS